MKRTDHLIKILWIILTLIVSCQSVPYLENLENMVLFIEKQGKFNGSILVYHNGKSVFSRQIGYADFENEYPITGDTAFMIGSITKPITAALILSLEEEGLLNVTDPLDQFVPGLSWGNRVTIHHLLTHSSGVYNYTEDSIVFDELLKTEIPPAGILEHFKDKPLLFEPGTAYSYSNSNYVLLGMIIEKVSGMSYEEYLKEKIIIPLELKNTGFTYINPGSLNLARGYQSGYYSKPKLISDKLKYSSAYSAGALCSTPLELAKIVNAIQKGKIISRNSFDKMLTSRVDTGQKGYYNAYYAYGWSINENHGTFGHTGWIPGYRSCLEVDPEKDIVIVILGNNDAIRLEVYMNNLLNLIQK